MAGTSFRFVIVENAHNISKNYFGYVPREPSPDLGYLLSKGYVIVDTSLNLVGLLDLMIKMQGGYIVVVCHGSPRHVHINTPLGTQLNPEFMDLVEQLLGVDQELLNVLQMPEKEVKDVIKKIEATATVLRKTGERRNISDIQTANAFLKDFVHNSALKLLGPKGKPEAMWKFLDKVRQMQKLNFSRVEFRACRVGSNPTLMLTLKKFFNCNRLVAPRYRVFHYINRSSLHYGSKLTKHAQAEYVKTLGSGATLRICVRPCGLGTQSLKNSVITSKVLSPPGKDGTSDHVIGHQVHESARQGGPQLIVNTSETSQTPRDQSPDPNDLIHAVFQEREKLACPSFLPSFLLSSLSRGEPYDWTTRSCTASTNRCPRGGIPPMRGPNMVCVLSTRRERPTSLFSCTWRTTRRTSPCKPHQKTSRSFAANTKLAGTSCVSNVIPG